MKSRAIYLLVSSKSNLSNILVSITLISAIMLFVSIVFVKWQNDSIYAFGVELEDFSRNRLKVDAMTLFFRQLISFYWIGMIFTLVMRNIAVPLSESYSVNQTLWLRLSYISPLEIFLVRLSIILLGSLFISFPVALMAVAAKLFHTASLTLLLRDVFGLMAYVILVGGIVLMVNIPLFLDNQLRMLFAFFATLLPVLLFVPLFLALRNALPDGFERLFPYASPFVFSWSDADPLAHYIVAALLGVALVILSALPALFARSVTPPFQP